MAPETPKEEVKKENTTSVQNTQEVTTSSQETSKTDLPETPDQINWRQFREERKKERQQLEMERKEKEKTQQEAAALKAALESALNKPVQQQSQYEEELTQDQIIDQKVNIALKQREKAFEEERKQREQREYPQRLVQTYSDFNQVCSTENLDYLEYHYPEVAHAFKNNPEGFEKWSAVYKAVKRFVPNTDGKKESNKADKNALKPQAMNASGANQTNDQAPRRSLDDTTKAMNYARMQKIIKGF